MNGKYTKFNYNEYIKRIDGHTVIRIVGFVDNEYIVDVYDSDFINSIRKNMSMLYIDKNYEHYEK